MPGFAVGQGLHMNQAPAVSTVVIADINETELAGHPAWIRWPTEDKRLLVPMVVDGVALWPVNCRECRARTP